MKANQIIPIFFFSFYNKHGTFLYPEIHMSVNSYFVYLRIEFYCSVVSVPTVDPKLFIHEHESINVLSYGQKACTFTKKIPPLSLLMPLIQR